MMLKYFADYNRWPGFYAQELEADLPHLTDKGWVDAMSPTPGGMPNQDNLKRIVFFEGGGGALGAADSTSPGGFVDPWGQAFQYQVDNDQNGTIAKPNAVEGDIRARVIAWSGGPDRQSETWEDNVTSWE